MSTPTQALAKTQSTPATAPVRDGLLQRKPLLGPAVKLRRKPLSWQPPLIQTKLTPGEPLAVGRPDDEYEQEADRIADQVMRMPEPGIQRQAAAEGEDRDEEEALQPRPLAGQITPLVQRQMWDEEEEAEEEQAQDGPQAPLPGREPLGATGRPEPIESQEQGPSIYDVEPTRDADELGEEEEQWSPIHEEEAPAEEEQEHQRRPIYEEEEEEEASKEELIQAKPVRGSTPRVGPGLAAQIHSLRGGGRPLSRAERGFFEPRFGYDFSRVRIHSNGRAAELSSSLNARAFTRGRDIVLGSGRYGSGPDRGRRLLAHELAHVIQQGGGNVKMGRALPLLSSGMRIARSPIKQTWDVYQEAKAHAAVINKLRGAPFLACPLDPVSWLRDTYTRKLKEAKRVDARSFRKARRSLMYLIRLGSKWQIPLRSMAYKAIQVASGIAVRHLQGRWCPGVRVRLMNSLRAANSNLSGKLGELSEISDKLENFADKQVSRYRVFAKRNVRWGRQLKRQGEKDRPTQLDIVFMGGDTDRFLEKLQKAKSLVHIGQHRISIGSRLNAAADNYSKLVPRLNGLYRNYDKIHTRLVRREEALERLKTSKGCEPATSRRHGY